MFWEQYSFHHNEPFTEYITLNLKNKIGRWARERGKVQTKSEEELMKASSVVRKRKLFGWKIFNRRLLNFFFICVYVIDLILILFHWFFPFHYLFNSPLPPSCPFHSLINYSADLGLPLLSPSNPSPNLKLDFTHPYEEIIVI